MSAQDSSSGQVSSFRPHENDLENGDKIIDFSHEFKDYLFAFTEVIFCNFGGRAVLNFTSDNPEGMNFSSIAESFCQPYIFDRSGFARNQLIHPYAGSMYFNSGRGNNLDFFSSMAMAFLGSFTFENIFVNSYTSINDMITTTMAGSVTGEVLHRLGQVAYCIWPGLGYLVSPVDNLTYLFRGNRPQFDEGVSYLDLYLGASHAFLSEEDGIAANAGTYIVYGQPFDHKSKSFYDQFFLEMEVHTDFSNYYFNLDIDGSLYSHPFYTKHDLPSSLGIMLNYSVNYSNFFNYSTNALGFFLRQKIPFTDDKYYFSWDLETNFIFLQASKDENENYYNFGPEAKITFLLHSKSVRLKMYSEFDYVFLQKTFHSKSKIDFDYNVHENFSFGLSDTFIFIKGGTYLNLAGVNCKIKFY
ncbi:MAG: DUF3943 domain-containing protein [Treponemataceae bacterium]|nr:DUF3943 domain-containing protein [Treponemataceae bacterium]